MKILMTGVYDLRGYSRGRIIYKGLKKNKVNVNIYLPRGPLKYFKLGYRLLKKDYDAILVTGKFCLLVSKLLQWYHGKKIFFDVFISDYDNLVNDRKIVKKNSIKSKLIWQIDRYACLAADHTFLDTKEHVKYFVKEFGLKKEKFGVILIGADEEVFRPLRTAVSKKFLVIFHGTFIPLQGIEYVIKAAKILEDTDIKFEVIGQGQTYKEMIDLAQRLSVKNITFLGYKKITALPRYLEKSHLGLGIFGNTEKTQRVIPNKAFEILAMKKCLITADTPASQELLEHKQTAYLCKTADEHALADAILELKKNPGLRKKIETRGYELFNRKCSSTEIGRSVKELIVKYL